MSLSRINNLKKLFRIIPFVSRIFKKELFTRNLYLNKGIKYKNRTIPYYPLGEGNLQIKELLLSGKPAMITRYGSVELEIINKFYLHYPVFIKKELMTDFCHTAGFFPYDKTLVPQFVYLYKNSAKEIDVLAIWNSFHGRTAEAKLIKQWSSNAIMVDLLSLESFWYTEPWSECLRDKKVLLILPFEKSARYQYEHNRERLFSNSNVLPQFRSFQIIAPHQGIGMSSTGGYNTWFDAFDDICSKITSADFDIAIIGAGAYGLPLAAQVKKMGKQAIHMGGATQLLFGIKGKRWEVEPWYLYQYKLYNEYWKRIEQDETPTNTKTFEAGMQGGYW